MKQYNYFQAFYSSFYSRDLYRDVAKRWGAGVVLYLLMVLAICWAISMVQIQKNVDKGYNHLADEYMPQIPHMIIKEGVLSTPQNHPYIIHDPEHNERVAVIDTSGKYLTLDQAQSQVLITQSQVIIKDSENQERIQKFPKNLSVDFEPLQIKEKIGSVIEYSWVILFPVLLFLSLVYRLVQAVIYAIFGKIFALIAGARLSYSDTLKLSMVAVTPVIIFGTILNLFVITLPFQLWIYFFLAMGYLIFAVISNK